jgi:hypothetical protein
MTPSILDAIDDTNLLGSRITQGASWRPWRAALAAMFGLGMDDSEAAIYRVCTGRTAVPETAFSEAWFCCGRRAGKSFAMALIAVYLACFKDYRRYMAHGERVTIMLIAQDRKQARVVLRYVRGMFQHSALLGRMVERETADAFDLDNRATIEIMTASHRSVRGYSVAACLCDEVAQWPNETAIASDEEILAALRPAMATIPGSVLICASSPYARKGALWNAYRRYYGQDDPNVLVWRAPSTVMNCTIPQSFLDQQFELDPVAAEAEYNASFRTDLEAFIDRTVIEGLVVPGRHELPYMSGVRYVGFTDAAGGSGQDSYTLAVSHAENGVAILDCVREIKPPFNPSSATAELAATARSYRLTEIFGDRYAGSWPAEQWQAHGVAYRFSERSKSEIYAELLPVLNSGRAELLDHRGLVAQLCSLERRTARGTGRDVIDHPAGPGHHDDVCNACAGSLLLTAARPMRMIVQAITDVPGSGNYDGPAFFYDQRPARPDLITARASRMAEARAGQARRSH